ncbi:hypothetical protein EV368DRAFT_67148 [Lentinula lateritia]|nr:hypothetical protein EV368DRAFT_67148 [Lentinula lateritia]
MFLLGKTLPCPRAWLNCLPSSMEKTLGRAHEWMDVQELLTGGTTFSILNIIDNTENSVSVQPFQPHGFRISERPSTSGHFQDVVVADQRVISFLEYFIEEDENAVVMIPLVPIFPSTEFLKHSVPISSERFVAKLKPTIQFFKVIRDLHSLYRHSGLLPRCQQGLRMEAINGISVSFHEVILWYPIGLYKLHELHGLNGKLKIRKFKTASGANLTLGLSWISSHNLPVLIDTRHYPKVWFQDGTAGLEPS